MTDFAGEFGSPDEKAAKENLNKPSEDLRRQSQKMEALGRLAGGVAHDFNNLLTAINGYADLLLGILPMSDPNRELADEIRKAGEKGAGLTRQLLAFSRKQKAEVKAQDLRPVIGDLQKLLTRLLPSIVHLEYKPQPDMQIARVDRSLFEQAIINLVVNARDASPQGGQIGIEIATQRLDSWSDRAPLKPLPGSFVLVSVSDQGTGMSNEVMAHLFEPFFTTKGRGRGTGLGLSTVYGVMQQLDGGILVESVPGEGSTFTLCFPAGEADEALDPVSHLEYEAPLGHGEKIALIENDDAVSRLTRRVLQQAGYSVIELSGMRSVAAASGFDGVICGVPTEFSQIAAAMKEARQWLHEGHSRGVILLGTGIHEDSVDSAISNGGKDKVEAHIQFLSKPFRATDLLLSLRLVLDA